MNTDWRKQLATILIMVTGALTAYYTTVYGIRLSVNEKADRATVEAIDRRLITIETILRTDIARQRDMADLRVSLDSRFTRIETLLEAR